MIAPDANLLIYAASPTSPFHSASRTWLEAILSGIEPVGFPIFSIYGFMRFMTNQSIHPRPATFQQMAALIDSWTTLKHVRLLYPGDRHWGLLKGLAADTRLGGAQVSDAAIAACALEFGATVYTNDRDFARFPGLRWHNPLRP